MMGDLVNDRTTGALQNIQICLLTERLIRHSSNKVLSVMQIWLLNLVITIQAFKFSFTLLNMPANECVNGSTSKIILMIIIRMRYRRANLYIILYDSRVHIAEGWIFV